MSLKITRYINRLSSKRLLPNTFHSSVRLCHDDKKDNLYPASVNMEHGIGRAWNILKNEFKDLRRGKFSVTESELFPSEVDVLIIGGGIIGSSIAYWLTEKRFKGFKCCVIDKDFSYKNASSSLSVGGVRQQFSLEENVGLSMFASEFLTNLKYELAIPNEDPPDVQFKPNGYLFMATDAGAEQLMKNYELQTKLGAKIKLFSPAKLKEYYPWINVDDIALASLGMEREGWLDGYSLMNAFRKKAIFNGARFIEADFISSIMNPVQGMVIEENQELKPFETTNEVMVKTPDNYMRKIKFGQLVIAAGCESGSVAKKFKIGTGPGILKHPLPVEPRKRYVYVFHCPEGPGVNCPMVIDPSMTYFRREDLANNFIAGCSPSSEDEPDTSDLSIDENMFYEKIWPDIAHRVPAFQSLKVKSSWAGYYDYNTFDQNAIIGNHPHHQNIIMATGFSGHGIQQSAGIGRAISELIFRSRYETIDLSRFSFDRIIENNPIFEQNII